MATWSIISHPDIWKVIQKHKKTQLLNAPKISFDYTATFPDKVFKEIKADPLLIEKIRNPCELLFNKMIAEMSKITQEYDKVVAAKRQAITDRGDILAVKTLKALPAALEKQLNTVSNTYVSKMDAASKKGWDDYVKLKTAYKKFRIKVRVDFALRGVGVAINAIKVVTAGPVGIVFAVQGTLKDAVSTANELYLIFRKLEKVQERIETGVNALSDKMVGGKGKKADVLKSFAASITGYCGKTGKQMQKELRFYEGRMVEYEQKAHTLSKRLNKLLEKAESLAKKLPKEVAQDVSKIETEVGKLITMVKDRVTKLPNYKTFHKDTKKTLDDLMNDKGLKNLDKWINAFETAVDAAKIATGAASTDASGWKNIDKTLVTTNGYLISLGKAVERHYKGVSKTVANAVA
ncbi:hypothetical protein [uncultured Tateyamaria sp.]|uniref:hypothetical protein n=1 Tax=uncultured Tateyamaria sp. TaxID=455651 RepID=UPI002638212B|nr:hypothetical protein [uncultured Tateyamaria sp.]